MIPEPFNSLISIILMILLGAFLCSKNWFSKESTNLITRLILDVAIPLSIISCVLGNITRDTLEELGASLLVPVLAIGLEYLISYLIARAADLPLSREGLFISMFSNPNTLFIGVPVNMAVFGTKSLPYVYIYYIVSTLFFNTIGILLLSKNDSAHMDLPTLRKNMVTPILISFFFTMFCLLCNIRLPDFIMKACESVGSISTPLSLLFIGICLYQIPFRSLRINREISGVILGRFLISPLITYGIARLLHTPELAMNVFLLQSFLPAMTSTPIFGERYHCDTEYATLGTAITALLSLIIIPLYSGILF